MPIITSMQSIEISSQGLAHGGIVGLVGLVILLGALIWLLIEASKI